MGNEDVRAIVQLEKENEACTGTLISEDWVLTAAHCLGADGSGDGWHARTAEPCQTPRRVVEARLHPTFDLALLRITPSAPGHSPILPWAEGFDASWVGEMVQLAGYGLTEEGKVGDLRFVAERITAISLDTVEVDGHGTSGACVGDSGGPLLLRDRAGSLSVAGVLSKGSATCYGSDTYVRLDGARDFVGQVTGATPSPRCGAIQEAGICFHSRSMRCVNRALMVEGCAAPEKCVWLGSGRYGCGLAIESPCGGVDHVGRCDGRIAERCEAGSLLQDECGDGCTLAPGAAECRSLHD